LLGLAWYDYSLPVARSNTTKKKPITARSIVMSWRFWRRTNRRSDSSISSSREENSAIAGVSPDAVGMLDRKASRYSLLETIAALSVIAGVVAEDWDDFGMFLAQPDWAIGRKAIGGFIVAAGIALEIWFSSRASSAERKIRDLYSLEVSGLNLKAEQERTARAQLIGVLKDADEQIAELKERVAWREITSNQVEQFRNKLSAFAGQHVYIVVDANAPGGEPKNFGSHIQYALGAANWDAVSKNCKPGVTIAMVTGVYALASQDGHCAGAVKALNELLHSMGFCDGMDEMSKVSRFLGPPYWPEEIWNSGSAPKVLIVVKEKPQPQRL
jgi:hypothetical protein